MPNLLILLFWISLLARACCYSRANVQSLNVQVEREEEKIQNFLEQLGIYDKLLLRRGLEKRNRRSLYSGGMSWDKTAPCTPRKNLLASLSEQV
mmetsp:Transcript_6529/g.9987  ORF Transcript_6529/g.9987 Transcript_6529/m.9987 type:complete len:94 (+) Transcript_6529:2863-3144(+)